ncbi:MAG TPA: right-handed parallel beta-helix repeat-containing protein [Acidimicrobiales bacterium]|nr:right-handed parallel beta-helix repeat-containing protein [Acidimicrobiales bacterium]
MSRSFASASAALLLVLSATVGAAAAQAPVDPCQYEGGTTDEQGEPLYHGVDPTRRTTLLRPFAVGRYPCAQTVPFRAVRVEVGGLELVEGGRLVDRYELPVTDEPLPFETFAEFLELYGWAAEVEPGVFELSAAVIQSPGTAIRVAAPRVTTVRLLDLPGVFVGGRGARARFEGVTITSWDPVRSAPDDDPQDHRPFVVYEEGSRLEVAGSQMSFLGSDRTSGYGVMWGEDTTGEVVGSTFDHNLFGVYTSEARDVSFRHSVFRDNLYYGFNLHTATHGVVAEDNEAYGNGSHGFVAAGGVFDNLFRRNRSHHNQGNGIVIDGDSNRNLVEGNAVEDNAKDGIAVIASSDNQVVDNSVRNHRVGVRISREGSARNVVRDNLIVTSLTGVQAFAGATETTIADNTVLASRDVGMLLDSPGSQVTGGWVWGGGKGIEIRAVTRIAGVTLADVDRGIVVTGTGSAAGDHVTVGARHRPVQVHPGGSLRLTESSLGEVASGPDSWMPLAGVAAVGVAVLLQALSHRRERQRRAEHAPPGVWNTT